MAKKRISELSAGSAVGATDIVAMVQTGTTYKVTAAQLSTYIQAGLLDYKGSYDASTNTPDLDTSPSGILKGDTYTISNSGTFFSQEVLAGDMIVAEQDNPTTFAHWTHVNLGIGQDVSSGSAPTFTADNFSDGGSNAIITTTQESNFESAYSHISNNGSDHSYINQDVTSGSAPTFTADNLSDGGSNAIITTTQESNFESAYTHVSSDGSDHTFINQDVGNTSTPFFNKLGCGDGQSTPTELFECTTDESLGVDSATEFLCVSNTTEGSTTFTDSSSNGLAVTPLGDAQHTTVEKKFGLSSIVLDGDGDYLTVANDAGFQLDASRSWTLDFWWYFDSTPDSTDVVISQRDGTGTKWYVIFNSEGDNKLTLADGSSGSNGIKIDTLLSTLTGGWHHYAFVHDNDNDKLYSFLDGVKENELTASTAITWSGNGDGVGFIGAMYLNSSPFARRFAQDYFEEIRITNDAKWTSNFTVPTSSYVGSTRKIYVDSLGVLQTNDVSYEDNITGDDDFTTKKFVDDTVATHADSNGSSHSYIDQDVSTTASPSFAGLTATTADINGGTVDGTDVTVGAGKTLDVSAGTLTLADNQISGDKVEGGTINATTINTLTSTTVNGTTFDTNVAAAGVTLAGTTLAADGTDANISITITPKGTGSVVISKADINGGTIDAADITVGAGKTLDVSGGTLSLADAQIPVSKIVTSEQWVTAPANSGSTGVKGTVSYGSNYFYVCVATDTWIRMAAESSF